ncbi:DNA-deoxyinosine glycosylase [Montanilutibacter psychrotolerans]|uniref:DNA-deoxyinosine glycosylase n=1 Tax=Montanilutibacter psychrotolerans TaxID=1327343 RepID=A0A3M8SV15_9GAMM|nr:DNA-deoxyinosine glycosylase [Lysobacter psychrotolerans]RNF85188.1 DNA-deoxyinosine glycosylase [Lysobacter psychrotolerans]
MPIAPSPSPRLRGFAPHARADARVLILGSMPGARSLQAQRYYAHPQNRFWPFMGELVGAAPSLPYGERLLRLATAGIALWDVLASCERDGSLDSAIRDEGAQANDFVAFFDAHRRIRRVLFNGAKAESSFRRRVLPGLADAGRLTLVRLPSTSPANASQRGDAKLAAWRDALSDAGVDVGARQD